MKLLHPSRRGMGDYPIRYLTEHTGGSIRHANIHAVDCQHALYDLSRDLDRYYAQELKAAELRGALRALKMAARLRCERCKKGIGLKKHAVLKGIMVHRGPGPATLWCDADELHIMANELKLGKEAI